MAGSAGDDPFEEADGGGAGMVDAGAVEGAAPAGTDDGFGFVHLVAKGGQCRPVAPVAQVGADPQQDADGLVVGGAGSEADERGGLEADCEREVEGERAGCTQG